MDLYEIIDILEKSVEKNGEITLTNKHLLNILKMAQDKTDNNGADEGDGYNEWK